MKRIFLYSYNNASTACRLLSEKMNVMRIKHERSNYRHRENNWIINWGSSSLEDLPRVINPSRVTTILTNKLSFFMSLKDKEGINQIEWTRDKNVASTWDGVILERHSLSGNSGKGIKIKDKNTLESCPLYVKYVPKKSEWRIHLIGDDIVRIQQKTTRRGVEPKEWKIRSHDNGFIFCVKEDCPAQVRDQAMKVHKIFQGMGLTFAAYDVIYNEHNNKAYVLEGNTAPGIEGETVDIYASRLKEYVNAM